jgi:hypothetical protein
MTDFSNSPQRGPGFRNDGELNHLNAPRAQGAIAFSRCGLGEEVLPGYFILHRDLALAVSALRIHADPEFLRTEAELVDQTKRLGQIPMAQVMQAASSLLDRLADRIDTKRGTFLVGNDQTVSSNILSLALPHLPQFRDHAEHITEAIAYVARAGNIFVIEGAQFAKEDLSFTIFYPCFRNSPSFGMQLIAMHSKVNKILRDHPDMRAFLLKEGILPDEARYDNPIKFWSKAYTTSHCRNNRALLDFVRTHTNLPDEITTLPWDGIFLASLVGLSDIIRGINVSPAAEEEIKKVNSLCGGIAKIVYRVHEASLERVRRSN